MVMPAKKKFIREQDRFVTKGVVAKIEKKVDAAVRDVGGIRTRLGGVENVANDWERTWKRVNALDVQVGGLEGELRAAGTRILSLEGKQEETRLRHDVLARDLGQGKSAVRSDLFPRVTGLESRFRSLEWQVGQ